MPPEKRNTLYNVLLVALLALVALFIYSTYGTYKLFSREQKKMQVFYITDAGINQAIWYLSTPKNLGGFGPDWRTKGFEKFHSIGKYTISVLDGVLPGEITIISTGEARNMVQMATVTVITGKSLPKVFNYAIYSDNKLEIGGESELNGNIFCNDDLIIKDKTRVLNGKVFVSAGNSIENYGNVIFNKGKAIRPFPVAPVLDTTFYYKKITQAKSGDPSVLKGDKVLKNYSLNGKTLYVNGNVTIKGGIAGPGIIVSTRNILVEGRGKWKDGVSLISNGSIKISGNHDVLGEAYIYSRQKLEIQNDTTLKGSFTLLSPTRIDIGVNCNLCGLIYAPEISLSENLKLRGSMAANNFYLGRARNINITYDNEILPYTVVGFNIGSKIIMKKPGSWKEIKG